MALKEIIKPLDGLRGVAAMSVVLGHFAPITTAPAIGVVLFFVISGFLIGKIYLDKNFTFTNVWNYGVARFARIYPLFAAVVLGAGLLNYLVPSAHIFELSAGQIVPHLLLAGAGHTIWTISAEFQFYALFVLIWWAVSKQRSATVILLPVLVVAIGVMLWLGTAAGRINLFGYLPIFVLGLIIAQATRSTPDEGRRWARIALPVAGTAYAVAFFAVPRLYDGRWIYLDPIVILVCVTLLTSCLLAGDCLINRVLSHRVLTWLGQVSFSIYLLHRVAQWIVEHAFSAWPDRFTTPIMIVLTLLMAWASNSLIEKPARETLRGLNRSGQKLREQPANS